jgi:S1-C subfamily serine protease
MSSPDRPSLRATVLSFLTLAFCADGLSLQVRSASAQQPASSVQTSAPGAQPAASSAQPTLGAAPVPSGDPEGTCEAGWVKRVYQAAAGSIVKVESAGGLGAGFVFGTPNRIATAFHVIDTGRPVRVAFADGAPHAARVVAVDIDHDLALLEVASPPAHVSPLPAESTAPGVGDALLAIGHPFGSAARFERRLRGLFTWSATTGIVSGKTDRYLQTDAALNPGNSGGPLLSCAGRVLGVVSLKLTSAEGISLAVPVERLEALLDSVGKQPPYEGRWTLGHGSLALVWLRQPGSSLLGFSVGAGLVGADRWALRLQPGLAWTLPPSDESPLQTERRRRASIDLTLGRRLPLLDTLSIYLVPTVGASLAFDHVERKTVSLSFDSPSCFTPGVTCAPHSDVASEGSSERKLRPSAGASLLLGGLELGYLFQLDVNHPSQSFHRLSLGLSD